MTSHNDIELPAGHAIVPPSAHLYRDASPATSPLGGFSGSLTSLAKRNSLGPYCADFETKCAQGDWCCNTGDTCSFDTINGAYLCCGASAGGSGCARVCAAGTFQCSSVCCSHGQTCFGGDTVSGYCVYVNQTIQNPGVQTTTQRAATTALQSFATATRAATGGSTTATGTNRSGSSSSNQNNLDSSSGAISLGTQIGLGVAVPLVVILLALASWFCIARCRKRRATTALTTSNLAEKNAVANNTNPNDSSSPSHDSPAPSPVVRGFPSLPHNAMIVSTPVQPFEFGYPRTPKTTLPPPVPETPATVVETRSERSGATVTRQGSGSGRQERDDDTPVIATPRLATPIDLLTAVAARKGRKGVPQ